MRECSFICNNLLLLLCRQLIRSDTFSQQMATKDNTLMKLEGITGTLHSKLITPRALSHTSVRHSNLFLTAESCSKANSKPFV